MGLFELLIYILEGMFVAGVLGSAVVFVLSFVEDLRTISGSEHPPEGSGHSQ